MAFATFCTLYARRAGYMLHRVHGTKYNVMDVLILEFLNLLLSKFENFFVQFFFFFQGFPPLVFELSHNTKVARGGFYLKKKSRVLPEQKILIRVREGLKIK